MSGYVPVLDSEYIIDGVRMELTPRQILEEAAGTASDMNGGIVSHTDGSPDMDRTTSGNEGAGEPLVDESLDPAPDSEPFDKARIHDYLKLTSAAAGKPRNIPAFCPEETTRAEIASALIENIWKTGHFKLDDIILDLTWEWDTAPVGNIAAFYKSVEAACNCLDMLGIRLGEYGFTECAGGCRIRASAHVEKSCEDRCCIDDEPADIAETIDREILNPPEMNPAMPQYEMPFRTARPVIGKSRKCPAHISGEESSWLIYIPFDTCKFRLGGSLLAERTGKSGGKAPETEDSDYFLDCYEVVREFVEDGVIVSGTATGAGGLMPALNRMTTKARGIDADISGISRSYGETDIVKILFGEVPGIVVEIRDSDFDYVDAEMLLQDVAYYPLGHPGKPGLRIVSGGQGGIAGILQTLLGQEDIVPEGED